MNGTWTVSASILNHVQWLADLQNLRFAKLPICSEGGAFPPWDWLDTFRHPKAKPPETGDGYAKDLQKSLRAGHFLADSLESPNIIWDNPTWWSQWHPNIWYQSSQMGKSANQPTQKQGAKSTLSNPNELSPSWFFGSPAFSSTMNHCCWSCTKPRTAALWGSFQVSSKGRAWNEDFSGPFWRTGCDDQIWQTCNGTKRNKT